MLVVLPVFLLLISALAIVIVQQVRPNYGVAWLIAVSGSLIVWMYILALRWIPVSPFVADPWQLLASGFDTFELRVDDVAWNYAFSLASLLLGVILTASARLQFQFVQKPEIWVASLVVTAFGLLAVFSNTPLLLVLAWTLIDITDFLIIIRSVHQARLNQQTVVALGSRLVGSLLVVWSIVQNYSQASPFQLSNLKPETGVYLLLGAGLRLGVIPLHLPYSEELRLRRGIGTIIRLVTAATSLSVLSRLPAAVVQPELAVPLLILTTLAFLYGAVMWYVAKNELDGRPYWVIALAALSMGSAIRGQPVSAMTWGVTMVLSGGLIFLYSWRIPAIQFLPMLGLLGLSGLPFSPAASGWFGLIVFPISALDFLSILGHAILMVGFFRHALRSEQYDYELENWVRIVYPIGIGIFPAAQWIIGVAGWKDSFTLGVWWGALVSVLMSVGWIFFLHRRKVITADLESEDWLSVYSRIVWVKIASVLNLNWLYRLILLIYRQLQKIILFTARVLEGDGGILWVLLFLALLSYLIVPGGAG